MYHTQGVVPIEVPGRVACRVEGGAAADAHERRRCSVSATDRAAGRAGRPRSRANVVLVCAAVPGDWEGWVERRSVECGRAPQVGPRGADGDGGICRSKPAPIWLDGTRQAPQGSTTSTRARVRQVSRPELQYEVYLCCSRVGSHVLLRHPLSTLYRAPTTSPDDPSRAMSSRYSPHRLVRAWSTPSC